jgi:hypothetical protein
MFRPPECYLAGNSIRPSYHPAANFALKHKKKAFFMKKAFLIFVVPAGIEPATQGFSVLCSTN